MQNVDFKALINQEVQMAYIPPKFVPGLSSATTNKIDPLDLEFERTVDVADDYAGYFEDLNNPEKLLDESA
jgi:hypothetical protein